MERKGLKQRWIDCVRLDMREMIVSDEKMTDRGEWKNAAAPRTNR
jgi:hypothetical protein